ncbi:unnamed protein product [Brugia pahangi]|uniref:Uncharacterized protein n=1 Tax=Brugia pahangi TaxID=6280 RepID=A0A0N4THI7_BRUPA|nr:unnamed protein product [Brugia pahangi]
MFYKNYSFLLFFQIPPLMIERKIFKTIRARAVSDEANNERERKEQNFNVQFYHQRKNDEIVELVPMISPMNRTKQWVEKNHENLKVASTRFRDAMIRFSIYQFSLN